jgi:hypothetical protein
VDFFLTPYGATGLMLHCGATSSLGLRSMPFPLLCPYGCKNVPGRKNHSLSLLITN